MGDGGGGEWPYVFSLGTTQDYNTVSKTCSHQWRSRGEGGGRWAVGAFPPPPFFPGKKRVDQINCVI